jgi:hypothetical protein
MMLCDAEEKHFCHCKGIRQLQLKTVNVQPPKPVMKSRFFPLLLVQIFCSDEDIFTGRFFAVAHICFLHRG